MKKIILSLLAAFSLVAVSVPALAHADYDIGGNICSGISPDTPAGATPGTHDCSDTGKVTNIFKTIISVLSLIVGALSVIMIIIGGFKYLVSAGESNAVTSAKHTIMYAVVGLVIALLAQAIVRFVFTKATCTPSKPGVTPVVTC